MHGNVCGDHQNKSLDCTKKNCKKWAKLPEPDAEEYELLHAAYQNSAECAWGVSDA